MEGGEAPVREGGQPKGCARVFEWARVAVECSSWGLPPEVLREPARGRRLGPLQVVAKEHTGGGEKMRIVDLGSGCPLSTLGRSEFA